MLCGCTDDRIRSLTDVSQVYMSRSILYLQHLKWGREVCWLEKSMKAFTAVDVLMFYILCMWILNADPVLPSPALLLFWSIERSQRLVSTLELSFATGRLFRAILSKLFETTWSLPLWFCTAFPQIMLIYTLAWVLRSGDRVTLLNTAWKQSASGQSLQSSCDPVEPHYLSPLDLSSDWHCVEKCLD